MSERALFYESRMFECYETHGVDPIVQDSDLLFRYCSKRCGQARIGSPAAIPSSVDVQPVCDRNAPVDGCLSMLGCGTHVLTTMPLSLTRFSNPVSPQ